MIRELTQEDASPFAQLMRSVEQDSQYMLFEPEERSTTVEDHKRKIQLINESPNSTLLAEESDQKLAGYLLAIGGMAKRNKHCAYIVIGILKEHRGLGLGTKLFQHVEDWAKKQNIHRLELNAAVQNEAGIALYKKAGFSIEGVRKDSLLINNHYVDEYYMAKLLKTE
ncbi:GNAT family protein [Halobacillus rhizosphaerae]|uniref:GNAT family N-acetyltransferase n=1 Tax=Halobacillus rhizosphaerae TaxID=3064889 RepID=UPI00398A8E20